MKRVSLIYNPMAGASRHGLAHIPQIVAALSQQDVRVEPRATAAPGDATKLAQQAVAEEYKALIVCGGDGTINEAAQALVGSETALAIWPCGTANVLAKDLRLSQRPEVLAELIASGQTRTISVGRATKPETGWQRYFLLMAGVGLDAAIVKRVNSELKRRAGIGAYFAAGLGFLADWQLTPLSLNLNGHDHDATFAVIANASSYGGWFTLAPQAQLEEDRLDVCLFNSRSRLEYLSYALFSLTGSHTQRARVLYQKTQAASAQSNAEAFVQLDGELVGSLPMSFESVPRALRVIAPH